VKIRIDVEGTPVMAALADTEPARDVASLLPLTVTLADYAATEKVVNGRADDPLTDRVDDAYRAKYRGSPYLSPMIGPRARAARVRITPREGNRP
jgi:hypothetical protein